MKKAIMILIALCFNFCFAESISGFSQLMLGQMFDFNSDSTLGAHWSQIDCNSQNADFFVGYDDACCLLSSCCCGFRIGSFDKLIFSLNKFDSTDFSGEIIINDTTLFREVDTLNHHHFCNALPSILIGTEVGMPNKELIDSMLNNFFIIKTRSSQYALVKILSYIWEPSGVSYIKCISGINFLWILQSDGSTKFDIPTEINLKFIVRPSFNAKIAHEGTTYFTASGRFFRCSKKIKNNLIISKRNAVWSKNIEIK